MPVVELRFSERSEERSGSGYTEDAVISLLLEEKVAKSKILTDEVQPSKTALFYFL